MFCSTIIATIGRNTLFRSVNSVLTQSFSGDNFEIIIVNDSGKPLPLEDWHQSQCLRIIQTHRRERSIARNTGAAIATGRYLHFLDDDDWLLPNALNDFWNLIKDQSPGWIYGGSKLVNRDGHSLIELHHGLTGNCFLPAMAGEWIPLQASLIDNELFHEVGGFNPLITGPEDIDLLRRITLRGNVSEIKSIVACIEMGSSGSTTDYSQHPVMSRFAREEILEMSGVYERMKEGAKTSFWLGKFTRIYLTSVIWNIQHRRIWTAISRLLHALWSMAGTYQKMFSTDFLKSVSGPYNSTTFERGIKEAKLRE